MWHHFHPCWNEEEERGKRVRKERRADWKANEDTWTSTEPSRITP